MAAAGLGLSVAMTAAHLAGQTAGPQTPRPEAPKTATSATASVKPTPAPSPSSAELTTPFLDANASARPRMMQLTTISGMKMPSAWLMASAR